DVYPVPNCGPNAMSINNFFYLELNGGPNLAMHPERIADYIFTIYSHQDCTVGGGTGSACSVIDGQHTSVIPLQDGEYQLVWDPDMAHTAVMTETNAVQHQMITQHSTP
ncbi:MAG: hypothetical protein D6B26_07630, partial [Spirochaetaceae bacterium]